MRCCDEPSEDCSSGQPATCNAGNSLFWTCEENGGIPAVAGQTLAGLFLSAKEACPLACEGCQPADPDPCASAPCRNGGTCLAPEVQPSIVCSGYPPATDQTAASVVILETREQVKGLKEEIAEIKELVSALASGRPGLHA